MNLRPILVCLLAGAVHAAPPGGMRAGLWETAVTSNMTGGKPIVSRVCITPKQLEDPQGVVPKMDEGPIKCERLDVKTSGSTVSWKMRCTGEVPMEGSGQMTAGPDSWNGKMDMTMKMQGQSMTMSQTMSGKRVGDCPAAK